MAQCRTPYDEYHESRALPRPTLTPPRVCRPPVGTNQSIHATPARYLRTTLIGVIGTLIGVIGTLSGIIGTLSGIIGTLIGVIGTLIGVIGTLSGIIGTLIGIIGTLIGVIGRTPAARRRTDPVP